MGLVAHGGKGNQLAPTNLTVISTSIGVFDENGAEIGFITSLDRSDTRSTQKIRHLNKADAGKPVEQQPMPEDFTLTVSGLSLYNNSPTDGGSILNRLPPGAGGFQTLQDQAIPFTIREEETHPAVPSKTAATLYLGCMMTSFRKPISIGTITVAETASITPLWVEKE